MAAAGDGWRPGSPAGSRRRRLLELLLAAGIVTVVHAAAIYALWTHRLLAAAAEMATLHVDFVAPAVAPPLAQPAAEPRRTPPARARETPRRQPPPQRPLLAAASRQAAVAAAPSMPVPAPAVDTPTAPAAPMPLAQRPALALGAELSVVCHHRPAPAYPPLSRRLEETGEVLVRVELADDGSVGAARIERSSGHQRLDDAALAAVRGWRCSVPAAFGRAGRAVALQPFRFVLQ